MIFGSVAEEALLFIYMGIQKKMNTLEYTLLLIDVFGLENSVRVMDWYRPLLDGDKRPELSVLGTDYIFTCPLRSVLSQISLQQPDLPIYNYIFDHVLTFDAWGPRYQYCVGHVCHGADLPFVFNTALLPDMHFNKEEEQLSVSLIQYWTNFVKYSNPNGPNNNGTNVEWPRFSANSRKTMLLKTPTNQVTTNYNQKYCDEWDYIGYQHGWNNQGLK